MIRSGLLPAMGVGFTGTIGRELAEGYVASSFAPRFSDALAFALRTDGRGGASVSASNARGGYRGEGIVVRELTAPLAGMARRTNWSTALFRVASHADPFGGAVQLIASAGDTPIWEAPQASAAPSSSTRPTAATREPGDLSHR